MKVSRLVLGVKESREDDFIALLLPDGRRVELRLARLMHGPERGALIAIDAPADIKIVRSALLGGAA